MARKIRPEIRNVFILLLFGIIAPLFLAVQQQQAGYIYLTMGAVVLLLYYAPRIIDIPENGSFFGYEFTRRANIGGDILFGIIPAVAFIFLNLASTSFTLGLPSLPLSLDATLRTFTIGYVAPFFEELLFRGALLGLMTLVTARTRFKIPFWVANIVQAGIFMIFHLTAYGESIAAAQGAFIAAFLFGLLAGWLTKVRNNLVTPTILHIIFNNYLLQKAFSVVVLG